MAKRTPKSNRSQGRPKQLSLRVFLLWGVGLSALVLGLSLLAGSEARLLGLLIFFPAIAASVGTVRQTVAASTWTALAALGSVIRAPTPHPMEGVLVVLLTVVFGAMAVYGCHWRVARETELVRLRSTAAVIQQHILHPLPELTAWVLVDGVYEPVHEDKLFGGDIYDVADTPYGTRVLIGDVQGKGLSAVGIGFAVLGSFREAAHREPTLAGLVEALETSVVRDNAYAHQAGEPERFVTALILCINGPESAQAVNCGHLAPYLLGPTGTERGQVRLNPTSVPLGLASLIEEPRGIASFDFPSGSTLLLYTDGLSEARNKDGAFYPLERRLADLAPVHRTPASLTHAIRDDVRSFTRTQQQDDIAILALRHAPDLGRPGN
ncbi:PP2C family protein-serine/threonine phosphatase [Streptomyces iconiensis]|uniref:PP2C family protein-serine/threonine phosphatase n=1 Tax=Streptomyces iconiensis TaxID=1384038 RepID=A0ABT6ZZ08_9ACTN|nr:PP2C family protein-serine/threonine phosphatase [Streptomyces iconiensis]MDJ1134302.1 PP2C family protein-serine/threonine phosphatase [Streptomyces iconiensis]